jgi:hypothetical protein
MEDTESDDDLRSIDHGGYEHQFASGSLTRPVCGAVLAAVTVVLACLQDDEKNSVIVANDISHNFGHASQSR